MSFQLSPGVNVSEIDATTVIPTVSTSTGAIVGQFAWGPVETRQLVDTEVKLAAWFGKPNGNTFLSFFSASNFLAYGNQLRVSRAANTGSFNAVANTSPDAVLQIKNEAQYEANWYSGAGDFGAFAARYAGSFGNTLKTSVCGSANAFSSNVTQLNALFAVEGDVGNTEISITGDPSSYVTAGDYVKLGSNPYIQVFGTNTDAIFLVSGLTTPIANDSTTTILRKWEYADSFDGAPGTSDYAAARNGSMDELHVVVVDEDGQITGVRGEILEKYPFVSKGSDAKSNDGTSIYYPTVIFNKSKWIYWGDHDANGTNWGNAVASTTFTDTLVPLTNSLANGADQAVTQGDFERAWDAFVNADVVDVSLLVTGEADLNVAQYVIQNIAEVRKDCVAFVSPLRGSVVDNIGGEADDVVGDRNMLTSSSYAVMDSNWKYQYDKYNDTYRWLPMNGDIAGLCVRTDTTRDPWFSPAGFDRGQIKNVVKLAWNPSQAERDQLYKNGVNPVVSFPGDGTVLYGDKTLLSKPSAFDRINVRRLFIVLEKAIARASKFSLFEFNDEFTRAAFLAMVNPFLRDVQGRRGIFDYRVVADETNNTPQVIDSNSFVGDIYIKPARSINFIQLNFVAVRTGVSFDEIVGKF
jgi:hypothetical protein